MYALENQSAFHSPGCAAEGLDDYDSDCQVFLACLGADAAHRDPDAWDRMVDQIRKQRMISLFLDFKLNHGRPSDFCDRLDLIPSGEMLRGVRVRFRSNTLGTDHGIDAGGLCRQAFSLAATYLLKECFEALPGSQSVTFKEDATYRDGERAAKLCILALLNGPLPLRGWTLPLHVLALACEREQHWWNCEKCFAEVRGALPQHVFAKLKPFVMAEAGDCSWKNSDDGRFESKFEASEWEDVLLPCPGCGNTAPDLHGDLSRPCCCRLLDGDTRVEDMTKEARAQCMMDRSNPLSLRT